MTNALAITSTDQDATENDVRSLFISLNGQEDGTPEKAYDRSSSSEKIVSAIAGDSFLEEMEAAFMDFETRVSTV